MDKPRFIQIGTNIINLDAVRNIEVEGSQLVRVNFIDGSRAMEFLEAEAQALLAILRDGYVVRPEIEKTASAS